VLVSEAQRLKWKGFTRLNWFRWEHNKLNEIWFSWERHMILFLGFKLVVSILPHEAKAVLGLSCFLALVKHDCLKRSHNKYDKQKDYGLGFRIMG